MFLSLILPHISPASMLAKNVFCIVRKILENPFSCSSVVTHQDKDRQDKASGYIFANSSCKCASKGLKILLRPLVISMPNWNHTSCSIIFFSVYVLRKFKCFRRDLSALNVTFPMPATDWTPEAGYLPDSTTQTIPWKPHGTGAHLGLTMVLDANLHDYYCSSTASTGFKVRTILSNKQIRQSLL
jgi:hypothetical protein